MLTEPQLMFINEMRRCSRRASLLFLLSTSSSRGFLKGGNSYPQMLVTTTPPQQETHPLYICNINIDMLLTTMKLGRRAKNMSMDSNKNLSKDWALRFSSISWVLGKRLGWSNKGCWEKAAGWEEKTGSGMAFNATERSGPRSSKRSPCWGWWGLGWELKVDSWTQQSKDERKV